MSRTLVLTIWPEQEIVVTDASGVTLQPVVGSMLNFAPAGSLTVTAAARPKALLYGTPVMNGGTP